MGLGVLACGWVRRLVVRLWLEISNFACNSPTALSNPEIRSLELQRFLTLLKLHPIELHATFLRPGPAAAHGRCGQALLTRRPACLKPLSPLRARACVGLKPPSPLRVRNGCFWCSFRAQRRCWFQGSLVGGEQWCCRFQWSLFGGEQWCRRFHAGLHQWLQRRHWFQSWHVAVSCARKCSPCLAW